MQIAIFSSKEIKIIMVFAIRRINVSFQLTITFRLIDDFIV